MGLSLLPFTSGWLNLKDHFPVVISAIGLLGLIIVAIYREMFDRPMPDPKLEEITATREQIIDTIVKRAKRYVLVIGVLAYFGITGYFQMTFGPQLLQLQAAEDDLKKINEYSKQIQGQKAEIERLRHDADSLRQDMERSRQDSENLQRALTKQVDYFNKRIKLLDSSLAAIPQASANIKKILEKAEEIDRANAEFRENQLYEVTIHYSNKDASLVNKIHSILEERGFKIYLDERDENEMSGFTEFRGTLSYYTSEDKNKAVSIKMLLSNQGINIKLKGSEFEHKKAKKYVVWL